MGLLTHHFALRRRGYDGGNLVQENIYRPTSLPGINPEEGRWRTAGRSSVMRKGRGGLSFPGA